MNYSQLREKAEVAIAQLNELVEAINVAEKERSGSAEAVKTAEESGEKEETELDADGEPKDGEEKSDGYPETQE